MHCSHHTLVPNCEDSKHSPPPNMTDKNKWRHTSIPRGKSYFHPDMQVTYPPAPCVHETAAYCTSILTCSYILYESKIKFSEFWLLYPTTINPMFQALQNSMIPLLLYPFLRCMWIQWGKADQNPDIAGIHSKWCNCQSLASFEIQQAFQHKSNSKVVQNPG